MQFIIKNTKKDNIYNLMRNIGYHFISKTGEEYNFIRSIAGSAFPRFDIYLRIENGNLVIKLHLDQKGPIYRGTTAHSGEYDGELVEKEAERIKHFFLI
ncbi:MAG: hypothetical protein ABH813_01435 [Patescibacteria group bacterium]